MKSREKIRTPMLRISLFLSHSSPGHPKFFSDPPGYPWMFFIEPPGYPLGGNRGCGPFLEKPIPSQLYNYLSCISKSALGKDKRETHPVHGISPALTRDTSKDGKTSCNDIIILSDTKVGSIPILFTYTPFWTWPSTATFGT